MKKPKYNKAIDHKTDGRVLRRKQAESEIEIEIELEYKHPFPIEQRKEFWNYGLNPITGMPPVLDSLENKMSQGRCLQSASYGSAKCNGASIL